MRIASTFKVIFPESQRDVLFYGLITEWFWVLNSIATHCSIYLLRKPKCWFLSLTVGCSAHPSERTNTKTPGKCLVPLWLDYDFPRPEEFSFSDWKNCPPPRYIELVFSRERTDRWSLFIIWNMLS